jgi:hypothetical protein
LNEEIKNKVVGVRRKIDRIDRSQVVERKAKEKKKKNFIVFDIGFFVIVNVNCTCSGKFFKTLPHHSIYTEFV